VVVALPLWAVVVVALVAQNLVILRLLARLTTQSVLVGAATEKTARVLAGLMEVVHPFLV
jgi:hypothetical protein